MDALYPPFCTPFLQIYSGQYRVSKEKSISLIASGLDRNQLPVVLRGTLPEKNLHFSAMSHTWKLLFSESGASPDSSLNSSWHLGSRRWELKSCIRFNPFFKDKITLTDVCRKSNARRVCKLLTLFEKVKFIIKIIIIFYADLRFINFFQK